VINFVRKQLRQLLFTDMTFNPRTVSCDSKISWTDTQMARDISTLPLFVCWLVNRLHQEPRKKPGILGFPYRNNITRMNLIKKIIHNSDPMQQCIAHFHHHRPKEENKEGRLGWPLYPEPRLMRILMPTRTPNVNIAERDNKREYMVNPIIIGV
jgi:hypothetical protein